MINILYRYIIFLLFFVTAIYVLIYVKLLFLFYNYYIKNILNNNQNRICIIFLFLNYLGIYNAQFIVYNNKLQIQNTK